MSRPVSSAASVFAGALALLYSCAQVATPTGGLKDVKPPRVENYESDSAAVNVTAKRITLRFNENIQLKDAFNQVFISPPLTVKPEVKAKNKTLTVEWNEALKPNTTYCIHFGEAIRDVNEDNILKNFRYVFSTGPFIDSLQVKGYVQNAFDLKREKGIQVMLYDGFNDSMPYKKPPSYFAKTAEDGSFVINNIRPGKYRIFALKDINNNYLYNQMQDEQIAFLADTINPSQKKPLVMNLFKEPFAFQYIKKSEQPEYGSVAMIFNFPVGTITFSPIGAPLPGDWKTEELNKTRDTMTLWIPGLNRDSLKLNVLDNNKLIGSLYLKLLAKEETEKKGKGSFRAGLHLSVNVPRNKPFDLSSPLLLRFNHPLKNEDILDAIKIKEDSLVLKKEELWLEKISLREYAVRKKIPDEIKNKDSVPVWKENAEYLLTIVPGRLRDILGYANDTIKLKYKTGELKEYGNVRLKINMKNKECKGLFQLLDEKGAVVKQGVLKKDKPMDYYLLSPGKYSARIICDNNENNQWDPGNYLKKIQPEKVMYYPGPVTIRSNWDLELEWVAD